jgi:hypothetical protein
MNGDIIDTTIDLLAHPSVVSANFDLCKPFAASSDSLQITISF